jgi:hypothetical protein
MFDNEIDWVMRIKCASSYRRAARQAEGMRMTMTQLQGRAHCKAAASNRCGVSKSVQCKKSVFRSATRERVSVASCSQANYQVDFDQDHGDVAPCAGVNSMVKLLRAHGGCLGRNRR